MTVRIVIWMNSKNQMAMNKQQSYIIIMFLLLAILTAQIRDENNLEFEINMACDICHSAAGWSDLTNSKFNHETTSFSLTAAHSNAICSDCHVGDDLQSKHVFNSIASDCSFCHQDVHFGKLGLDCAGCHNAESWYPDRQSFFHELTSFPLTGMHTGITCNKCHTEDSNGLFSPIQTACQSCHMEDESIAAVVVPDHNSFINQCEFCHKPTSWNELAFNHSNTGFELTKGHSGLQCSDCHQSGYNLENGDCFTCHLDIYNQTLQPVHIEQIYVLTDCAMCHDASGWESSIYNHEPMPESCSLCHLNDMLNANLNIAGHYSLPNQCQDCHVPQGWDQFDFDHSVTAFALEGIHLVTSCTDCHSTGFALTPNECQDCHIDDYTNADDPVHDPFNFQPDNCHICHSAMGWEPAIFHSNIDENTECSDCHDFNGITDELPEIDHASAIKLGSDINNCTLCHSSTTDWTEISFGDNQHDGAVYGIYFDIYSGEHNNQWGSSCTENCHTFNSFDTFSCYETCHESSHSRSSMNDEHCDGNCESCNGSNGYWMVFQEYSDGNWQSETTFQQCYQCHPNGDKSGGCADDAMKPFFPYKNFDDAHQKENITK